MKKLFSLSILFLLCVAAHAGSLITATIIVTNTPADGDTITVNASARTWKTSVATPASQITIGASIGANATNMFNQFAGTPLTTITLNRSGTNGVTLRGIVDQTISVSIAGTWGYYTLSTNTTTEGDTVRVPASSYQAQSKATNIMSQLASDLGTYSTNALASGTTLVSGLVQITGTQTVTGNKTFSGANTYSSASQVFNGGTLTNVAGMGVTNIFVYGNAFLSNATPTLTFHDTGGAADEKTTVIDFGTLFRIRPFSDAGSPGEGGLQFSRSGPDFSGAAFPKGVVSVGNSVAGDILYVKASLWLSKLDHTTLATGNNAGVSFGATSFAKVASGPGGAFTINGIVPESPSEGQTLTIYNATGFNMTIANDSGVDPTPANRIYTNTGSDISTTGNGVVSLIYDIDAARWIVTSIQQ